MCCLQGKISLPEVKQPPQYLKELLLGESSLCAEFRENIRMYNSMFAFTSMGGRIDPKVNTSRGPFVYRMSGQNMHMIGSMLPIDGRTPRYAQLYIYDTDHEISHRMASVNCHTNRRQHNLNQDTVRGLQHMLDRDNRLVKIFRMARDFVTSHEGQSIGIKLIHKRGTDPNRYNMPSAPSEVAALIVGDIGSTNEGRDIIVKYKSGLLERIKETHPDFLPLQYPLLFPFGDGGYNENIPHVCNNEASTSRVKYVSMREYFSYIIHERDNEFSVILRSGKLFQQFVVDAYTMMEAYRLQYVRYNQKLLRAEMYKGLTDAILVGETEAAARGKRIILPSSFTGGPRYIMRNYQDAVAICGWAGYPDLFITFTCNPKWPELTRAISCFGSRVENRPELVVKVFKMKLDCLIKDLKKGHLFGPVKAC